MDLRTEASASPRNLLKGIFPHTHPQKPDGVRHFGDRTTHLYFNKLLGYLWYLLKFVSPWEPWDCQNKKKEHILEEMLSFKIYWKIIWVDCSYKLINKRNCRAVSEWRLQNQMFRVWKQRGHPLNLTSSGEAWVAALQTQETYGNRQGWSEMKNSLTKSRSWPAVMS